jgi:superfamily II RNA helicase
VFVYEHRTAEPPPPAWFPTPVSKKRWQKIEAISAELQGIEDEAGVGVHRAPDPTFIAVAYAWAAGEGFAEVVEAEELSGGDFVRTTKQLIDVLRQLALVAPSRATRRCAEQASERLFRGVVAASSTVEVDSEPEPVAEAAVEPHPDREVQTDVETEAEAEAETETETEHEADRRRRGDGPA